MTTTLQYVRLPYITSTGTRKRPCPFHRGDFLKLLLSCRIIDSDGPVRRCRELCTFPFLPSFFLNSCYSFPIHDYLMVKEHINYKQFFFSWIFY